MSVQLEAKTEAPGGSLAGELRRQLTDVEESLEATRVLVAENGNSRQHRVDQILLRSIEGLRAKITDELQKAELLAPNVQGLVNFDGGPVSNHSIELGFLGLIIPVFNRLAEAIERHRRRWNKEGSSAANGGVRIDKLRALGFVPGSFGLILEVEQSPDDGDTLPVGRGSTLRLLTELLANDQDSAEVQQLLAHRHLFAQYRELLSLLASHDANLHVRRSGDMVKVSLPAPEARIRLERLSRARVDERTKEIHGEWVEGNIHDGRFQLKVEGDRILKGKASERAQEQMRGLHLGNWVVVTVRETLKRLEEGDTEPKSDYEALELRLRDELV